MARFLSLARSKPRLCSANHKAGYFSNMPSNWLSIDWDYSEQETENGPFPLFHEEGFAFIFKTVKWAQVEYTIENSLIIQRVPYHLY